MQKDAKVQRENSTGADAEPARRAAALLEGRRVTYPMTRAGERGRKRARDGVPGAAARAAAGPRRHAAVVLGPGAAPAARLVEAHSGRQPIDRQKPDAVPTGMVPDCTGVCSTDPCTSERCT